MRIPSFFANLANLLNEATILTRQRGKTTIFAKEMDDSILKIVVGMKGIIMTNGKSKITRLDILYACESNLNKLSLLHRAIFFLKLWW